MTAIKLVGLFVFAGFLSCGENSHKSTTYDESRELVPNPEGYKKDTFILAASDTSGSDRWHFRRYLNDPKTPALAKNIFFDHWKLKDDEPLEFLDKLHGQDKEARPFYFRVVTNSYKQADASYAEGLGNSGYEYVRKYPEEFTNYFVGQEAFSDKDLQTWADIIMLELEIITESEYDKPWVKTYIDSMRKNCKQCSVQQEEVIDRYSRYLNERWSKFLQQVDK